MKGLAVAGVIAAGAIGVAAYAYSLTAPPDFAEAVIPVEGAVAAPEAPIALTGGETTTLGAMRGDVVLVTVWATWCNVCKVEMPRLDALAEAYDGRGLVLAPLSVDDDSGGAAMTKVADYIAAEGFAHIRPMLDVNLAHALAIGVEGTPTSIVVDKFGQVVAGFRGPAPWDSAEMRGWLDELIAADTPETSRALLL